MHVSAGGNRLEDKYCDIFLKIVSQHSEVKIIKAIKIVCVCVWVAEGGVSFGLGHTAAQQKPRF